uniref:Uncharacterized protein isoform X1 n=1 Tax=Nicotiana tabacum TaxID=4097 RepID=A0A1S3ZU31_TOBAC|nr:PREDICTED: uncharacterized protein LOC107790410 isoform X1 [Nicotiana tabacum]
MESEGEEASHLRPKRSKHTNPAQFSSISMESEGDKSSFKIPTLPPELITEILLKLPVKCILQMRYDEDTIVVHVQTLGTTNLSPADCMERNDEVWFSLFLLFILNVLMLFPCAYSKT